MDVRNERGENEVLAFQLKPCHKKNSGKYDAKKC
jgi:hypothetical protein